MTPRRFASSFEMTLFALALATAAALRGQGWLLRRTLVVSPAHRFPVQLFADTGSGGHSSATWVDQGAGRFDCEIRPGFAYAFCSFTVVTGRLDLRPFTHMRLWMRYQGAGRTLRVFLRNFDPAYSREGEPNSLKYNQVELQTSDLADPVVIRLSDFQVADWWLLERHVPLEHAKPEFAAVGMVEVQTGTGVPRGLHRFTISRIEFTGRWLSTERFYLGLILLWLAVILGHLLWRMLGLRRELEERRVHERELVELNRLLNLEKGQLASQARTDPLTGARNRAGLREVLQAGAQHWQQQRRPLSIVLLDLDCFKAVNDTHGHECGDEVLVALVRLVKGRIRSSDTLARWGGDEFVVVCQDTALHDAAHLAVKLRATIEETPLVGSITVTASCGVAALAEDTVSEMFRRADEALYAAKRGGRNRVEVSAAAAEPEPEPVGAGTGTRPD